jgi:hypothetical protein
LEFSQKASTILDLDSHILKVISVSIIHDHQGSIQPIIDLL